MILGKPLTSLQMKIFQGVETKATPWVIFDIESKLFCRIFALILFPDSQWITLLCYIFSIYITLRKVGGFFSLLKGVISLFRFRNPCHVFLFNINWIYSPFLWFCSFSVLGFFYYCYFLCCCCLWVGKIWQCLACSRVAFATHCWKCMLMTSNSSLL